VKALRWTLFLALGLLLPRILGLVPGVVEALYSVRLFPWIASLLSAMSRRVLIDLAQVFVVTAVVVILWILVHSVVTSVKARSLSKGFHDPHRWIALLALGVWSFYGLWGLNYARPSLMRRMDYTRVTPDAESLSRLNRRLAAEVNRTYEWANQGAQLAPRLRGKTVVSQFRIERSAVGERLDAAYGVLQPPFARRRLVLPKFPLPAGWFMTRAGISGVYFPYTGEASVNRQIPEASIPFVMAHEMAHQRGTAREDEANFWAYLACRETGLAAARYSGALGAFGIALRALAETAPDSARVVAALLEDGPRGDRAAIREFWQRNEGPVSRAATRVNDSYLKINAQRAGVRSYDLAVELLLAMEVKGGMEGE
jgi:hypothetical protein